MSRLKKGLALVLTLCMMLSLMPVITPSAKAAITMGTKPASGTTTGNPFVQGTGGSNSFRIPAMVTLNNGTIVAAADARWNTTYDGGGLDTIVSYSTDDGANWNYTFANYLGDNGNEYNGSGSTAFIDPCLTTDGETVYMLCDLYPYGVALNGNGNTAPSTAVGFNSDGTLKLAYKDDPSNYNYYLKDGQIYDSSNNVVSGYTVDAYFNITGNGYDTNLFFSDSPYKVVRTGYLYLTSSSDGGETWSEPVLIPNVKTSSEQVCLVGPGRGLVTYVNSTPTIIFPVYSYNNGDQQMGFIYSSNGGETWSRSANFTGAGWSSESAVVELKDGTLRFFYRNGTSALCYADYTWDSGWGSAVNTGIATNSNTQISAISLQNTVDGKQVILVSCPTGSNNAGSSSSSGSARLNGRIQIGLVNSSNNTMSWADPIDVTTNNSQFMYSCLTALTDSEGNETGKIAILYENKESAWGTGSNCYYTMDYATYDLSSYVTFDEIVDEDIYVDNEAGVSINFGGASHGNVTVEEKEDISALEGKTYVAYDISVSGLSDDATAKVTISLSNTFAEDANLCAVYINDNDEIAERIQGDYDSDADTFTFTAKHFSTYAVTLAATKTEYITLTVGGSKEVKDETGNYEKDNDQDRTNLNTSIARVDVEGSDGEDSTTQEWQLVTNGVSGINSTDKYLIVSASSGNAYALTSSGGTMPVTIADGVITIDSVAAESNAVFSFEGSGTSWAIKGTTGYLYPTAERYYVIWWYNLTTGSTTAQPVTISGANGVTVSRSVTSNKKNTTSYLTLDNSADASDSPDTVYLFKLVEGTSQTNPSTTITFTGVSSGKTSVVVGNTLYNITVNRKTETVNLTAGGTATYDDASTGTPVVADSKVATASLKNGVLTITGVAEGTTTVTTGTTIYTVTVSDGTNISIKENTTTTISVDLKEGQTVEWSSADGSYVGVAGKYDTTTKAYTNEAILAGQNVTDSPVTVTATIKDADGNVVGTQKWLVTVTEGDADTNTSSKGIYFNIDTIENCTVYYSINGGELIPVNGTGVTTGNWTGNGKYTGHFNIMFFAAPDEGYALTYMFIEDTDGQYYTLTNGNPDGTGSDAWPFNDAASSTIPSSSSDSAWKTLNGSLHGFRWALMEGNMTIDQMKVLFSNAIALGCDGVTTQTKNSTDGIGSASYPKKVKFVAQKLPTVEKTITSITHDGTETAYTDGTKVEIGDTINYSVVVTRYATNATYGTITYDKENLTDALTTNNGISNPDMGTSTTSDKTYTYTTSLTLTMQNFADAVKNGKITNTAEFSYTYSSQYSAGSLTSKDSAVADITVNLPEYVIDFGLPVTINLSDKLGQTTIASGKATYGTITANGTSFTYTPDTVLKGIDHVMLTLTNGQSYGVNIYPATTVYYEEGFATLTGFSEGSKGTVRQTDQTAGSSSDEYGYDDAYVAGVTVGASNSTQATSTTKGSTAEFTFTGTGVDIYTNSDTGTGWLMIQVKDSAGKNVKLLQVDTALLAGTSSATNFQNVTGYNVPVASITGLTHGTYSVTITHVNTPGTNELSNVNLDGFRIYETLDPEPDFYVTDNEDDPTFIELRDEVLTAADITNTDSKQYADQIARNIYSQVFSNSKNTTGAVILSNNNELTGADRKDLLDKGPKNEIYLQKDQALVFNITTPREVQIGLKALDQAASYTISKDGTAGMQTNLNSSTDMFYTVANKGDATNGLTITITNKGPGILSITKLKICDDPNATLGTLTADDLIPALVDLGIVEPAEESGGSGGIGGGGGGGAAAPVEPSEPTTPPAEDNNLPFTDVTASDWFRDSVKYVYSKGLMNGTSETTFSPLQTTNRAMIVTILYRLENSPAPDGQAPFADVPADQYYADSVAWAAANGIVTGTSDTAFAPLNNITREQLAVILYRYAQYKKYDVSVGEDTNILSFTDAETISEYAIPAIQWAVGAGLINGKGDGRLDPQGSATRAEVSAILARFCEAYAG